MANRKQMLFWLAAGIGGAIAGRAALRRRRFFAFAGRNVLITGGSRGLGLEMARILADEGANLAICARDIDELKRAESELTQRGARNVFILPCDVTDQDEVEAVVQSVESRFGSLDVLINNAGIIGVGPMEEMTLDDYERAMRTHYWAPLYATLAALPGMRARRSGRIVNIASIGGKVSVPHLLPYSGSKFALVGLSEGMRAELIKDNIYVTTVCPGLMRTGSHVNAEFKGQHEAEYSLFSIVGSMPLSSMNAGRAARQILNACRMGDPQVVLSASAILVTAFHALFPGATAEIFGLVNRLLPGPGGVGSRSVLGRDSRTAISPSILTQLSDTAANRNNEWNPGGSGTAG